MTKSEDIINTKKEMDVSWNLMHGLRHEITKIG